MKKLHFLAVALLLFALSSCKLDGESYRRFYGKVTIDDLVVQDSAFLKDIVPIYALAGAPNGCWSDLTISLSKFNDTLYVISAFGWFESYDNICTEIYVLKNDTLQFIPEKTGSYIFVTDSAGWAVKYDTLVVTKREVPGAQRAKR